MSESTAQTSEEPVVVFKSRKNRKPLRNRPTTTGSNDAESSNSSTPETSTNEQNVPIALAKTADSSHNVPKNTRDDQDDEATVLVKVKRPKIRGVAFSALSTPKAEEEEAETDGVLTAREPAGAADLIGGLSNDAIKRFAPPSGVLASTVNVHMERYVASKLGRLDNPQELSQPKSNTQNKPWGTAPSLNKPETSSAQATVTGKIVEVELDAETRRKNIEMMEAARRRMAGDMLIDDFKGKRRRQEKRSEEEIQREQAIDNFLNENRVKMYDLPPGGIGPNGYDEAEKVAEKFRQDFLDAMTQRGRRRRAPKAHGLPPKRPGAKREDEGVLKGPKLGGSRNVRSQVRDILLQQQEAKARGKRR